MNRLVFALSLLALSVDVSLAAAITPTSFGGPFCQGPPFGTAPCALGDQYIGGGLQFRAASPVAVFSDPPLAWGGIDGANNISLVSPVAGYLVVPTTTDAAVTDSVTVYAGNSASGTLTLSVYDISGALIGSSLNPTSGLSFFSVSTPGIHSFSVSGADSFGVQSVEFGNIASAVPEPGTFSLLAGAVALAAVRLRRR